MAFEESCGCSHNGGFYPTFSRESDDTDVSCTELGLLNPSELSSSLTCARNELRSSQSVRDDTQAFGFFEDMDSVDEVLE